MENLKASWEIKLCLISATLVHASSIRSLRIFLVQCSIGARCAARRYDQFNPVAHKQAVDAHSRSTSIFCSRMEENY